MATTLLEADLPGLTLRHRGKVRDVFDLPPGAGGSDASAGPLMLMVATDRLSAFDVVLPDPIPGKGEMLCQVSNFWFAKTAHIVPNHLTGIDVASVLPAGVDPALYALRSVVTKKLKPVPVEAIARGYLIGSGWKDYQRTGRVSGIGLPDGLHGPVATAPLVLPIETLASVLELADRVRLKALLLLDAQTQMRNRAIMSIISRSIFPMMRVTTPLTSIRRSMRLLATKPS